MFLKKLARWIVKFEIQEMQNEIKELRSSGLKQSEDWSKTLTHTTNLVRKQQDIIDELNDQIKDLKYQNDILRQYYHLDEEPSEEVQTKIRIDMRCHDLERELDRQHVIADMAKAIFPLYRYNCISNQLADTRTMMDYPCRFW